MAKYDTTAPWIIKIAKDIDILDNKSDFIVRIVITEKMTKDNWKRLIAFDEPKDGFKTAIRAYGCDICNKESSEQNPIYTNNEIQGVDICSDCMDKAFQTLEHEDWIHPGPTYSLKKIIKCARK